MTGEEMKHAIEFLLQHSATVDSKIERNSEQIDKLTARIDRLTINVERHSEQIAELTAGINTLSRQAELDRQEMREAIGNLIIGNEVTRDLAQKVAALQLQMSHNVADIDRRVTDLESK